MCISSVLKPTKMLKPQPLLPHPRLILAPDALMIANSGHVCFYVYDTVFSSVHAHLSEGKNRIK